MTDTSDPFNSRWISRILLFIERTGNRLPHPALVFIYLALAVAVMSWVFSLLGVEVTNPISGENVRSANLLSAEGIYRMLSESVSNFTQFAPVGVVLAIMLGVGIAEDSGLIAALIRRFAYRRNSSMLAYSISFIGVLSSIGADVGYVVLIPLAGLLYHSLGRPPLAGIAVAFAAVSAGFSANLFLGPVDVMLAGISSEAAKIIDPDASVAVSANYYFIAVSTLLISLVCGWLNNHLVEPHLVHSQQANNAPPPSQFSTDLGIHTDTDKKSSFRYVTIFSITFVLVLTLGIVLPGAPFSPDAGRSILTVLVPLLAIYFGISGYLFGRENGQYNTASDAISSMETAMQTMAYYIVLMFFAAQFVNWFNWSNLGIITAILGANGLQESGLGSGPILVLLIFVSATINLLIGSASAKWALIAPVFVPMLMLVNISPDETQMAYRIGDSCSNIITPLMPYFGIVLAYAQRYDRQLGLGNIVATMLPYSISLLVVWSTLFFVWLSLGLPLGF